MFTHKDVLFRKILVVNSLNNKTLRVINGNIALEDTENQKILTKLPCDKILTLFIIGHCTITTPLIEKCHQFGIAIVIMKNNFRPLFFYNTTAEANYLLRQKQYALHAEDTQIAKKLIHNKIQNQLILLQKIRDKNSNITQAILYAKKALEQLHIMNNKEELMGIEGFVAKYFFAAYFEKQEWQQRRPRTKIDPINAVLDIGYTFLFNYIECFVRLFGFDPYIGVYHRLWFQRKSLICDLIEPFRCIIDYEVRKSFNLGKWQTQDFDFFHHAYHLKKDKQSQYTKMFFDILVKYKSDIFIYIREYYRYFMNKKNTPNYPLFIFVNKEK